MFALVAGSIAAAPSAAPAASYTRLSYMVPVTQPDEAGLPVSLDTDVYLPSTPPPPGGYPLMEVFHGGGSVKDNPYDAGHAASFARAGFVAIIYSQRGDGNSGGQTAVAGPNELHDLFDVTAWALKTGGRTLPLHPDFHIDPAFIALSGYSQGGLNTNLGAVWSVDPAINPYGIRIWAIEPANTPDVTFQALVPGGVVKLSFVAALAKTYGLGSGSDEVHGRVAPEMAKWFADLTADQPSLYGSGSLCDLAGHDAPTSTMQQDLAFRSVGCFTDRVRLPWLWAQAFDDTLFPPDMAVSMFHRAPDPAAHRLYLSMGGHAAPSADPSVEEDRLQTQIDFLLALHDGRPPPGPPVVYWTRDPAVSVSAHSYTYPPGAWYRQTSDSWPPGGVRPVTYTLSSSGELALGSTDGGAARLTPFAEDEANDPIAQAAASATPVGTTAATSLPPSSAPGLIASFTTAPFAADRELSGSPAARLRWTPASPDTQLVLEVLDRRPDGTLTLLSRGVQGIRGATAGDPGTIDVSGNAISALVHRGDRVVAWVMDGDSAFYEPYPGSLGGTLALGAGSTLTLPLRGGAAPPARPAPPAAGRSKAPSRCARARRRHVARASARCARRPKPRRRHRPRAR